MPSIRISLLTNDVCIDGVPLVLSNRENELLTLLALCGGYAGATELAALMSPQAEPSEALATLWDSVAALQKSLPQPSMLHNEKDGYGLDATIAVDLWEIDAYLRRHRYATRSQCSLDNLLYRRLVRFHHTQRLRVASWSWSLPIRTQIDGYRRDIGLWLGWGLLAQKRVYEAHAVAKQLVAGYPGCTSARGLLDNVERHLADSYLAIVPKAG